MNIEVTRKFMTSVLELDKRLQRQVMDTLTELENNPKSTALSIHKINKCKCDESFRSARVNDDVRIIFAMRGDAYTLLYVGHHEDAYDWCENRYFGKTEFGAEMIYNSELWFHAPELNNQSAVYYGISKSLLENAGIKLKQLEKLGIPEEHAENLLKIFDENQFIEYCDNSEFPLEIQEALLSLVAGDKTYDEVYNDLVDQDYQNDNKLDHKDTQRRFHMLQSLQELEEVLEHGSFEQWTIFLHPEQEKLVKRSFNGPALIEGGPGTGKTIVGIHRALFYANSHPDQKILICTFGKKLSLYIDKKLDLLAKQKGQSRKNIKTKSVDSLIRSLYYELPYHESIVSHYDIDVLIRNVYRRMKPTRHENFFHYEYSEIIERQHIETLEDYVECNRSGNGKVALSTIQREELWPFFSEVIRLKRESAICSFVDAAHYVDLAIKRGEYNSDIMYNMIVIDEAQDLEPIKLQVLNDCTINKFDNNLFILSDLNQRVYKLNSWKRDTAINIIGRTHYLSINYRTTKQISDYARYEFSSGMVQDHIHDYKSILSGVPPIVEEFSNLIDEQNYILQRIQEIVKDRPAEEICVVCPTKNDCKYISAVLSNAGIRRIILEDDKLPDANTGINICTIQGVKGLEFGVVFIYQYSEIEKLCMNNADGIDELRERYILQADCEKYVAMTRARDTLYITYTVEGDYQE